MYGLLVLSTLLLAVAVYMAWWWHTTMSIPDLVTARPTFYRQDVPVRAVLIWREELVRSSTRGSVQYRYGSNPASISKGELIATVMKGGKGKPVYSPKRGYFIPGLDGLEGAWRYSSIWTESFSLPEVPEVMMFSDFAESRSDRVIGKLIPQPQVLRAVFYSPLTESLKLEAQSGFIEFRLDPLGSPFRGDVRVVEVMGQVLKVYMDMPFFPLSILSNRDITLYLKGGEWRGAELPESAVVIKNGKKGVFQVRGDRVFFREVRGIPMPGDRFLVYGGLNPGNLVLLNGMIGKEGRIKLW
nr:efflux RND transporter periplasmic adaptor subunit [uncultured Dethiosulfovibrio sp.]